jgi:hypothetical protein
LLLRRELPSLRQKLSIGRITISEGDGSDPQSR